MKRAGLIVSVAALLGVAAFGGAYLVSQQVCRHTAASQADDLDWLRVEFKLSPPELEQVRKLHEGYLPQCADMCRKIAAKKRELEAALAATPNGANSQAAVKTKLDELALLRAQCQLQMLQHFSEVSRAMPAEQARRYLAEMQRLTLGAHEQIEQSMSDHQGHAHGNE